MAIPSWVYLDTWIEDDFETELFNPSWSASEYALSHEIHDINGDKCAVLWNNGDDSFKFVTSDWLEGDVDIEVGVQLNSAVGYDFAYIAFFLDIDVTAHPSILLGWGPNQLNFSFRNPLGYANPWGTGASISHTDTAYGTIKLKLKRSGNFVSAWWWNGAWTQIGSDLACPTSNKIKVQAQSTDAYLSTGPGFSYFYFQADTGIPSPTPPTASFDTDKHLAFVGTPIKFDASTSTGSITNYHWDFDDGGMPYDTSLVSATYSYTNYGNRLPSLITYNGWIPSTEYHISADLIINPQPYIVLSGTPTLSGTVAFQDYYGAYYSPGTISLVQIDFDDASPIIVGSPTSIYYHAFTATGTYTVKFTYYDTAGNISIATRDVTVLEGSTSIEKDDYISMCGPNHRRFGPCKSINLTEFLPSYLQETDTFELTQFYENFLNDMYSGLCGFQISDVQSSAATSASDLTFIVPQQNLSADPRISILEKIRRLADLHDPDLIDEQYLQFFAKYLGYNVNITRNEIGGFGTFLVNEGVCSASDSEKYLRFMISNLPNWYKIKTTRDMIRVMLYSFGLVGDIIQYYTKPIAEGGYDSDFVNWKLDDDDSLTTIPSDFFPTPHFAVKVDIDASIILDPNNSQILTLLMKSGDKIIRAIEGVRPINDVFHNLTALTKEYIDAYVGAMTRFQRYIRVDPDGTADWWVP